MANSSHNCALDRICKNCRKTYSQYDDGSSITRFSYEFKLLAVASGFVGESPLFSTSHADAKLDWLLELGPKFGLTLHLRERQGRDSIKVRVICCWKLPFMTGDFKLHTAINESLYSGQQLPTSWKSRLPDGNDGPRSKYAFQCTQHDCSVLLDISLEDQIHKRVERLGRFMISTLKNGRFSDVTLEAGGRAFPAHKAILWQRWPALRDRNNDSNRIILDDVKSEVLETVLEFMYSGKLEKVNDSHLPDLTANAKRWHLDDLSRLCEDLINKSQDTDASRNGSDIVTLPAVMPDC